MRIGAAATGARSRFTALAQRTANITPAACTGGGERGRCCLALTCLCAPHSLAQETGPGPPSTLSGATGAEKPTGPLHKGGSESRPRAREPGMTGDVCWGAGLEGGA